MYLCLCLFVQEVEVIREVPVPVEKLVERVVTKEVFKERIVYKDVNPEQYVDRFTFRNAEEELRRLQLELEVCCIRSGEEEEEDCCCGGNECLVPGRSGVRDKETEFVLCRSGVRDKETEFVLGCSSAYSCRRISRLMCMVQVEIAVVIAG